MHVSEFLGYIYLREHDFFSRLLGGDNKNLDDLIDVMFTYPINLLDLVGNAPARTKQDILGEYYIVEEI